MIPRSITGHSVRNGALAMPALITHDFFGRDVYDRLFRDIGAPPATRRSGRSCWATRADPLFYAVSRSAPARAHNRLGNIMHGEEMNGAYQDAGTPWACAQAEETGCLIKAAPTPARWDSCAITRWTPVHAARVLPRGLPRLCDAGEPDLSRADGHEVHAVIEASWTSSCCS